MARGGQSIFKLYWYINSSNRIIIYYLGYFFGGWGGVGGEEERERERERGGDRVLHFHIQFH